MEPIVVVVVAVVAVLVAQLCPTLCNLMEVFSVHGIFQARTLEWVAIS